MKCLTEFLEEKQTKIFEETGAFFAFSQKQFDEQKKDNIKYVSIGSGLICPKINVETLQKKLDTAWDAAIREDVEENGAASIIEREFFNHETQTTSAFHELKTDHLGVYFEKYPEQFTNEIFYKTCKNCMNKAIDNDWF